MPLTKKQNRIIKRWVEKLRSGDFKQGRAALRKRTRNGERYCCLGVLCEMAVKAKVIPKPIPPSDDDNGKYSYSYEIGCLPNEVREWAGLRDDCGEYDETSLTDLNDKGTRFERIADIIESKPSGMFVE